MKGWPRSGCPHRPVRSPFPSPARTTPMRVFWPHSGALPRDSVDRRIVEEVRTRTGHIVSTFGTLPVIASGTPYPDRDGDGMSDDWEVAHGLNPDKFDAWGDKDGDGWTNLDKFLDSLSKALNARP